MIRRSFIPHLVHYSFLPLHGQTTFREGAYLSPHWLSLTSLLSQSSLHYYYYLTTHVHYITFFFVCISFGNEERRIRNKSNKQKTLRNWKIYFLSWQWHEFVW
jgi:hypothetical protein